MQGSLQALLGALDGVLTVATARFDATHGSGPPDPFRGLHVSATDVARDLGRDPGATAHAIPCDELFATMRAEPRIVRLASAYALTSFDAATVALALAPDLDARYERVFAYLNDDVTRRRATPTLALDLFTADPDARGAALQRFAPEAPLIAAGILELQPREGASRLSSGLSVDPQILRFVAYEAGLDPRLSPWCTLLDCHDGACPPSLRRGDIDGLERLAAGAIAGNRAAVFHFQGRHGTGKLVTARALAARLGQRLLVTDARAAAGPGYMRDVWRRVLRETVLQKAVLFVHGYDALVDAGERQALRALPGAMDAPGVVAIVAGARDWASGARPESRVVTVRFGEDDVEAGAAAWRQALERANVPYVPGEVDAMAAPLRLAMGQIESAVETAMAESAWEAARAPGPFQPAVPDIDPLRRAARAQGGHALGAMSQRIRPRRVWSDLVLPDPTVDALREVVDRVRHRRRVMRDWGFDARLSLGKGTTALFAGPSGTGKTLAAEVIAGDLGFDLFRIDLASVVS